MSNKNQIQTENLKLIKSEMIEIVQKLGQNLNIPNFNKRNFESNDKNPENNFNLQKDIIKILKELQSLVFYNKKEVQFDKFSNQILKEYYIMGKLLERCYIYSTDIEYSQFYNKELTLRIDNFINELKMNNKFQLQGEDLRKQIDDIFEEIEKKKIEYFQQFKKREFQRIKRIKHQQKIEKFQQLFRDELGSLKLT